MVNFYEEIKGDIPLLARLYDTVKTYNLTKDDINNIVHYAPEHIYLKDDICVGCEKIYLPHLKYITGHKNDKP